MIEFPDPTHPARAMLVDSGALVPDPPPPAPVHRSGVLRMDAAGRSAAAKHVAQGPMHSMPFAPLLEVFGRKKPKADPKRATKRRGRRTW